MLSWFLEVSLGSSQFNYFLVVMYQGARLSAYFFIMTRKA